MYYGWKIVAALGVVLTFSSGLSFYNHAIYLNALADNPAFTVETASTAVSLFFLTGGVTGLLVARSVQLYDVRICFCIGALISCLGLSALAYVENLPQLFAAYMFLGAGFPHPQLFPLLPCSRAGLPSAGPWRSPSLPPACPWAGCCSPRCVH